MKRSHRAIWWGLLSCLLLIFIFGNSMQDGESSSAASNFVLQLAKPIISLTGADSETGSLIIRKAAHFTEFALLGACLTAAACNLPLPAPRLAAVYTGTLCAIADEFIQRFVEGRSSQIADVIIDMSGVLCGAALCTLLGILAARRAHTRPARQNTAKSDV